MVYPENIEAIGVHDYKDWLNPKKFTYKPRSFRDSDVDVKIECCGVCGSDIHAACGNWGQPYAPVAVGHEIIGTIVKIGPKAKSGLKLGDRVGIGAQIDCDDTCQACQDHYENNCTNNCGTYFGTYKDENVNTQGGDASHIRANSKFVFKIPENLKSEEAAPLLCGGITGAAPLFHNGVKKGTKVGVVALGGIGHMTVLFAKALGAEVTVISRSRAKEADAKKLGADHFVPTNEPEAIQKHKDTLDLIVNTGNSFSGSAVNDVLTLLKARAKFVFITGPPHDENLVLAPFPMLLGNYSVSGSAIGSPEDIEYMLKLASEHNIKPWVETVPISEENLGKTWKRAHEGDVHYRFTMTDYDKCFETK